MSVTPQTALRTDDFIESIGVGTHLTDTLSGDADGDLTKVEPALVYLGVDNVRDLTPGPSPQSQLLNHYLSLGSFTLNGTTYKTKFDLISVSSLSLTLSYADKLAPYVSFIEGPNEVNVAPITFKNSAGVVLTGRAAAIAFQQALYTSVNSDPLLSNASVMTFSLAPGSSFAGYGDLSAYADYANVHAYGQEGIPPPFYLEQEIKGVPLAPSKPYIVTETGNYTDPYSTNGVNEDVQAKLIMETLLDDFKNGVKLTYIYELLDAFSDPNYKTTGDHYGLFNADGTPKLAATAIHDLTTILGDSASTSQSFATTKLAYSVTGLPATGEQMLMEKSDGTYDIALWQEPWIWNYATSSNPLGTEKLFDSTTVTVTLGQVYQTINVYDPLVGSAPIYTYHNVSSVDVALNTGALIVEIVPNTTAPIVPTVNLGSAGGAFTYTDATVVNAGSGAATVTASGSDATVTVTGSTGTLAVNFTGSAASVTGGSGALTVVSNSGSNTVIGGAGAFSYTDFAGNDSVTTGTSSNNIVQLGSGQDMVTVRGATTLTGGTGSASITLSTSGNSVTGGLGTLTVTDNAGGNTIVGDGGVLALTITGTGSDDTVTGSTGALTVTDNGGGNTITGGDGTLAVTVTGTGGEDSITGADGALTVTDNGGGNTVSGGAGVLTVTDLAGGDLITTGSSGKDKVTLGAGGDIVVVQGAASVIGGAGAFALQAAVGGAVVTTNNTAGLSTVALGAGADTITVNGATYINDDKANVAVIGNANLSINGGSGSLTFTGHTGSEYIFTQGGTTNLLNLGSGANIVLSHGQDTITASTVSGAGKTSIYAAGSDTITGGAGTLLINGQGVVSVTGGTGAVRALAAADGSYIKGGSLGGNVLNVSGDNTTLVGGGGGLLTDIGSGDNLLMAVSGATTLTAGSGNDTLVGGSGVDKFVLTAASAAHSEVIQNYKPGTDTLSFVRFGAAPIANQTASGGNLQLTLSDHTQVTLIGVTSL